MKVLEGGKETFQTARPTCIVSIHSEIARNNCYIFFEKLNYLVSALEGFESELICIPQNAN